MGYYKIARHYKWALDQVFLNTVAYEFDAVVITEDDLNVSPDFFAYFAAMYKVLAADSTLYCVSAWNDNGKKSLIDTSKSSKHLYYIQTDIFVGSILLLLSLMFLF